MNRVEFEAVVDRALEGLPSWVLERLDNLHVVVEDRPSSEEGDVLGLYEGVSLLERSGDYWGALPDRIVVYRIPHLELGLSVSDLEDEIRRTVLHEVAHHLGIDDTRLAELGWD
ncbi:MAG TPA: metallopeptidase family protein [Acidimicrobiia bacterium]|nr:metallopeptidase family protein [Acidimicrobiia bacterium]